MKNIFQTIKKLNLIVLRPESYFIRNDEIFCDISCGHISDAIREACLLALTLNCNVKFIFNEQPITIYYREIIEHFSKLYKNG